MIKSECAVCYRNARYPGGILIPLGLTYGLCMEHVGWLPPASGNEFIRYVEIDVKHVDIYTPVRVNNDGTITELLRDYDSSELARVRIAADELWGGGGDGDHQLPVSKHAQTIEQTADLPHPHLNAAGKWACEYVGCDVVDNAWLNLSTGRVLCGCPLMYDGSVIEMTELSRTGCKYPLVVNLDTIDASGDADVYSFEEDTKVVDPYLKHHLAHFGLDMSRMHKRLIHDELNKEDVPANDGRADRTTRVYGAGLTGLMNLGSSYMSSIMQALHSASDVWTNIYTYERMKQWFEACVRDNVNPLNDFNILLGKLLLSMHSDIFSRKPSHSHPARWNGICPLTFIMYTDEAHPKLSTTFMKHDADGFLREAVANCESSLAGLQLAGMSTNDGQVIVPRIPLVALITAHFDEQIIIGDGLPPLTNTCAGVDRYVRMRTMPKYLWIAVQRYGDDYTTEKEPFDLVDAGTLQLDKFRAARTESQHNEPAFIDDETMWRATDGVSSFEPGKHYYTDGPGEYELRAIVVHSCHMNTLPNNRHFEEDYVAYVRADITKTENSGNWLLFEDDKVSRVASSAVPINKAYMMMYSRDFEYLDDFLFL